VLLRDPAISHVFHVFQTSAVTRDCHSWLTLRGWIELESIMLLSLRRLLRLCVAGAAHPQRSHATAMAATTKAATTKAATTKAATTKAATTESATTEAATTEAAVAVYRRLEPLYKQVLEFAIRQFDGLITACGGGRDKVSTHAAMNNGKVEDTCLLAMAYAYYLPKGNRLYFRERPSPVMRFFVDVDIEQPQHPVDSSLEDRVARLDQT
jgi:hypothetical protein